METTTNTCPECGEPDADHFGPFCPRDINFDPATMEVRQDTPDE